MTDPILNPSNGRVRLSDVLSLIELTEKNIQHSIEVSEQNTSREISDLAKDVQANQLKIEAVQCDINGLKTDKAIAAQRSRDIFRIGNIGRSSVLLVVAVGGLALGFYNILS